MPPSPPLCSSWTWWGRAVDSPPFHTTCLPWSSARSFARAWTHRRGTEMIFHVEDIWTAKRPGLWLYFFMEKSWKQYWPNGSRKCTSTTWIDLGGYRLQALRQGLNEKADIDIERLQKAFSIVITSGWLSKGSLLNMVMTSHFVLRHLIILICYSNPLT